MLWSIGRIGRVAATAAVSLASVGAYAATQKTPGVHVCVGADRIMRYEPSERCPAGQTMYRLVEVGTIGVAGGADNAQSSQATQTTTAQRLSALERQVKENSRRVVAPFEVVDENGATIIAVGTSPRGMQVMNAASQIVAAVAANPDGGYFRGSDPAGNWVATIGVKANTPQMLVKKGSTTLAGLLADNGKPMLQIFNGSGINVSNVTVGPGGAGYVQLTDPAGKVTVEAGTVTSGVGVVHVGPRYNCSGKMGLVVPDCIAGHQ